MKNPEFKFYLNNEKMEIMSKPFTKANKAFWKGSMGMILCQIKNDGEVVGGFVPEKLCLEIRKIMKKV